MVAFDRLPLSEASFPTRLSVGDGKDEPGLHSLSGLGRQCFSEAFEPWFTHSDITSSLPSEQQ